MNSLILKTEEAIKDLKVFNKPLVVGVSGGPDSVALVYILKMLNLNIRVAHLNHGLRGEESEDDAKLVKALAKKMNIPYTIEKRFIPNTGSIQQAARNVRYNFFAEVCKENNTDTVFLAQHADDQLETVLMNFFRGASITGLSGIKRVSRYRGLTLIRPFLRCTKKEILTFLKENNIDYRIDSSNLKEKYLRNKFRLNIIPFLEENLGHGFKETILRNVDVFSMEEDYLNQEAQTVLSKVLKEKDKHNYNQYDIVMDVSLKNYHKAIIARVIKLVVSELYQVRDFTSQNIFDIVELCLSDKPKSINLPNGAIFAKWDNNLAFYTEKNFQNSTETVKIVLNEGIIFGNKELIISESKNKQPTHEFSADQLKFPLFIRSRKEGDRIKISVGATKKLKSFFIDEKIPRHQRDNIPILTDANDNIVSVVGYRVSPQHYIREDTRKKLYLYVKELGGR